MKAGNEPSSKVVCISVVRDPEMYRRCVGDNPNVGACVLRPLDNQQENAPVSVQYNRFLDAYDYADPAWLFFCHEDFELLSPPGPYVGEADPGCLYGPIGAWTKAYAGLVFAWRLSGSIVESDKQGRGAVRIGTPASMGSPVETFDCQCLVVHSSLIAGTGLRFDPRLSFDLYVEDFCIQARERHGVVSRIMPLPCRHWSHGSVGERYRDQESYLRAKYPSCCYTGTSSYDLGTPGLPRRCNRAAKVFLKAWLVRLRHLRRS